MSAKGRNWGDAVLDNETLQFHTDGRPLFNVALPDVVQVQPQHPTATLRWRRHPACRWNTVLLCWPQTHLGTHMPGF